MRRPALAVSAAALVVAMLPLTTTAQTVAGGRRHSTSSETTETSEPPETSAVPDSSEPPASTDGGADPPANATGGAAAEPPADPGDTNLERRLAAVEFANFLGTEVGVHVTEYACTEPPDLVRGTEITCFAVVNDRLIVAMTTVSGGTFEFEFEIVNDTLLTDTNTGGAGTPTTSGPAMPDPAAIGAAVELGEALNAGAAAWVAQYLTDVRVAAIARYEFDAGAMMLILDMTLVPSSGVDLDELAWANTREFARYHWAVGQPLRTAGAALRPGFTFIVDGSIYFSDYDLMVAVADETITQDEWLELVSRSARPPR